MTEAAETPAETPAEEPASEQKASQEPKEQPRGETPKKSGSKKPLTDNLYEEKIGSLQDDLTKLRANYREAKAERDELKTKVVAFELKEKKSGALSEAISDLGEDFEIPTDKLPTLNKLVDQLQDGEGLVDSIKSLVDTVKSPKASQQRFAAPWGGNAAAQQPGVKKFSPGQKLTAFELASLSKEEADAYHRSQQTH